MVSKKTIKIKYFVKYEKCYLSNTSTHIELKTFITYCHEDLLSKINVVGCTCFYSYMKQLEYEHVPLLLHGYNHVKLVAVRVLSFASSVNVVDIQKFYV